MSTLPYVTSRCELCNAPGIPNENLGNLSATRTYPRWARRDREVNEKLLIRQKCERWSPSGDHRVHYICRGCMSAYNIGRVRNPTKRRCPHTFTDADHAVAAMRRCGVAWEMRDL